MLYFHHCAFVFYQSIYILNINIKLKYKEPWIYNKCLNVNSTRPITTRTVVTPHVNYFIATLADRESNWMRP